MINFRIPLLLIGLMSSSGLSGAAVRVPEVTSGDLELLRPLRPEHPRLVALEPDIERVRELIRTDPLVRDWYAVLRKQADETLTAPPAEHVLIGPRLLDQSRKAMYRMYLLGLLYRLEGDARYARRAQEELRAVCAFPDWNPSHFLDTAEMAHAVAIGYDWFHDELSTSTRHFLRSSLIRLGFEPAMKLYRSRSGFVTVENNWNQVCNGGLMLAALAVAEEEPEIAAYILREGRRSLPWAMKHFAPDGGWIEGPGYWSYTTRYCVALFSGLETSLGSTLGLDEAPGFSRTGFFRIAMAGPRGLNFNWGDGGEQLFSSPQLFWLAGRYDQPVLSWFEREFAKDKPEVWNLLWARSGKSPRQVGLHRDWYFRGVEVVSFRSAWEDPPASFVAMKGGDNDAPHANLDLGSFVFDADGERWVSELGGDDYNLPGYWDRANRRYRYYRLGTLGQNTLTLNGHQQDRRAKANIVHYASKDDGPLAIVDLSAGYAVDAARVMRGISLGGNRRHLLVQDELESSSPVDLVWHIHTRAGVEADGSRAILKRGKAQLKLQVLTPEGARVEVHPATRPRPEATNAGISRVEIRLPQRVTSATLAVLLSPIGADSWTPEIHPLKTWGGGLPHVME